jgi:hypothetical protein
MDKQYILDEIRRTALDGKPLGRMRFLEQTGIKERDWSGIYWTKWSDAQVEAGFGALSLNSAYDEEQILRCVSELARRLGKVPTTPEMQFERRANRLFPNDRVISRRWNRAALVERLRGFCATHTEYHDVLPIVGLKSAEGAAEEPEAESSVTPQAGYVYVIRARGAHKIGCTRAPYRRAAEIANQSANGAELIHLISTDDPEGIEKYWHGRFSMKRLNGINKQSGEWFALSADDVRAFKKRKFM